MCTISETKEVSSETMAKLTDLGDKAQKGGLFTLVNAVVALIVTEFLRGSREVRFCWLVSAGDSPDAAYLDLLSLSDSRGVSGMVIPATMLRAEVAARIARACNNENSRLADDGKPTGTFTADEVLALREELFALVPKEHVRAACRLVLAGFRPAKDAVVTQELRQILS